jgi:hypothetical protein
LFTGPLAIQPGNPQESAHAESADKKTEARNANKKDIG